MTDSQRLYNAIEEWWEAECATLDACAGCPYLRREIERDPNAEVAGGMAPVAPTTTVWCRALFPQCPEMESMLRQVADMYHKETING